MQHIPTRTMGQSGLELPVLGLGGAPLGELFETMSEVEAQAIIEAAWNAGVRFFDTAPWYGHGLSEHRLGHFLRAQPRNAFKLSTKVGRVYHAGPTSDTRTPPWVGGLPFTPRFDYSRDGFMRSFEDSLMRLSLQRVDMLVIHDLDPGYHGTGVTLEHHRRDLERSGWPALEALRSTGQIAAIGAGINDMAMIPYFLERCDLDYLLVAMPYTLLDQAVLHDAFPMCAEKGVSVVVGAPYASGILASGPIEGAVYGYAPAPLEIIERTRAIERIARDHGVALAAAALQFPLGHERVVSVIPGAARPAHAEANVAYLHAEIPAAFWAALKDRGLLDPSAPVGDGGQPLA